MNSSSSMTMSEARDHVFEYDSISDLDIQEAGDEVFDGTAVHDISYRGVAGNRIKAFLVIPVVGHSFPGMLFVHPLPGSRRTFLYEALKLSQRRICSISVDAPWSTGMDWAKKMGDTEHDRQEFITTIKDLRRAFDVLIDQGGVDVRRIGYVGHSLGALCGGVLAGADRRAKAYVLMSGTSSFSEVAAANMPDLKGEALTSYRQTMSGIDPLRFVPRASPAQIMFQMGENEEFFDHQKMQGLVDAASEPKIVRWYKAGHVLNEQAQHDRDGWLEEVLFH